MTNPDPAASLAGDGSELSRQRILMQACRWFENEWKAQHDPKIETTLLRFPIDQPHDLIVELIAVEAELRYRAGQLPHADDYLQRFPIEQAEIEQLLADAEQAHRENLGPFPDLPHQFGRYQILKELGRGGMGIVYLAHDQKLDRQVALKIPIKDESNHDSIVARFENEARSAAVLTHPGICPVHDVGEIDGHLYLTMSYIEGRTLESILTERGQLPVDDAALIVGKVAVALQHAHDQQIIHTDLKPSNILIDQENQPVVMDFGLATRNQDDSPQQTIVSPSIGSPAYMAPEIAAGQPGCYGPAADVYSLGVIFYRLITGQLPFPANRIVEVSEENRIENSLSTQLGQLPEQAELVSLRALNVDPQQRFTSMEEFAAALEVASSDGQDNPATYSRLLLVAGPVLSVLALLIFLNPTGSRAPVNEQTTQKSDAPIVDQSQDTDREQPGIPLSELPRDVGPPAAVPLMDLETSQEIQRQWAEYLNVPVERTIDLGGGVSLELVLIPPGWFQMGTNRKETKQYVEWQFQEQAYVEAKHHSYLDLTRRMIYSEAPSHAVSITEPFYLGKFEVTHAQWVALNNESVVDDSIAQPDHPIYPVNRNTAQDFLSRLNERFPIDGFAFCLPTEAQWEYACRAGTTGRWSFSSSDLKLEDEIETLDQHARINSDRPPDSNLLPVEVGGYTANAWGLHDMHGNVAEWCEDQFRWTYYKHSPKEDPPGSGIGAYYVVRGGHIGLPSIWTRSSSRTFAKENLKLAGDFGKFVGFRVAAIRSVEERE